MNLNQNRPFNYQEAFDRNIGWLSAEEQECLRTSCVAVAGLGGAGGYQVDALARLGVGQFKIADPDTFEISNVNRQAGAFKDTLGRPKTEVIHDRILSINPEARVDVFPSRITRENVDAFLDGVDLVIDGIDYFEQEAKLTLFQRSREKQLTAITSCPLGFGASVITFAPDGMRYEDYFDLQEDMTEIEKKFALSFGLSPSLLCLKYIKPKAISFETRRAASVAPGLMLVGALTASEAVKILTGRNPVCYSPHIYQIDLLTYRVRHQYYRWGMKSPWLRLKRRLVFMFLSGGFKKVPWMTLPQAT
ncbi:MAG: ThiF family adenylyltransferase [Candidatus Omnitrophica bacterium]|nr:ThiF family adenylyltransferase [Candidatus Omnitrophota bacterium]